MTVSALTRTLTAAIVCGGVFLVVSGLQSILITEVAPGVSAPYLPAGVRIIAATVYGFAGCLGVFLASLLVARGAFPGADWPVLIAIAGLSGFVPLLSLIIVRRLFGIGEQLLELSFRSLLILISLQSVLSPLAHQVAFVVTGAAPTGAYNLAAMIAGDLVGCILIVLGVATVWGLLPKR